MSLYAAYGSNMDPTQMLRRCPSSSHAGTCWIQGWRLTFGAGELG
ncbi:putative AIG2-like family protein (fragment) [Blastococcus saxobsidens DD2]|uniref:Putative AIG2-like family protein n=1 Tax=Blastococcus saxobsidens (strain DD2) TaxID=1146883 RepID=H6RL27_BLASD